MGVGAQRPRISQSNGRERTLIGHDVKLSLERALYKHVAVRRNQPGVDRPAATGFDKNAFAIDGKARQARCPAGKNSAHWNPVKQHGAGAIVITFSVHTCRPRPFQEQRTSSELGPRTLT
jgi:hypothetical protein